MKRILSIIICCFFPLLHFYADDIILKPTHSTDVQQKRTPIRTTYAHIDGHTLTFDSSLIGCTITLYQNGIKVYSTIIYENEDLDGMVILPDHLVGNFQIDIEVDSITFVGEIEL